MSLRTIAEFNHDYIHRIEEDPNRFMELLGRVMRGGDQEAKLDMEVLFGLRMRQTVHHSTPRKLVLGKMEYDFG